jgi:hypothetical protein
MKKHCLLIFALLLVLLLSACERGTGVTVYRVLPPAARTGGELVVEERVNVPPGLDPLNALVVAFNAQPDSAMLINPLPQGAAITGFEQRGGNLRLLVSGLEGMNPFDLSLLHCCATLSFCAVEGIGTVSLYSDDGETEIRPPLSRSSIMLKDIDSE